MGHDDAPYRTFFENAPLGFTRNTLDGVFLSVNERYAEMVGRSVDELVGMRSTDITEPADTPRMFEDLGPLMRGETGTASTEHRVLRPDGSHVWLAVYVSLARDDRGEPTECLAVAQDVTRLREAEAEARALELQLRHAQKLESLGVLAGGIAHDFNNILTGMLGSADLALSQVPPGDPTRGHWDVVKQSAQRAAELCRQLLAYAGKGRFVVRATDVGSLVNGMVELIHVSLPKKVVLRRQLTAAPPVMADQTQLRQVILNLDVNAAEAIGEDEGVVTVAVESQECDADYLRTAFVDDELPAGRYVCIEVSDTGAGMDEQTRQRIFDPFFTTKRSGRGLGLAAVMGIVRGHGGAIRVYSEVGSGTTFKIVLPVSDEAAREPSDRARPPLQQRAGLALLADDEPMVRQTGRAMLEAFGFDVLLASDGEEAMALFRERPDEIDLVVLDMTMPKLGGGEVFRAMRTIDPDVRVVLISGYNEQDVTTRFAGKGLAGFLQKPFTLDAVRDVIRQVLGD